MPRPPRVEFPDALYHITARGIQKAPIVADDHDCVRWMEYLKNAVLRFALELYTFTLMDNHYHLFVSTPQANLGKAMQYLNGSYAMYFNVRHKRGGHLFERRYRGILVEDQGHYTEVSRYIHLNPVRAGIVERPEHYLWSSYAGYHSGRMPLSWMNYERVLAEFGEGKDARRRYREFVVDGVDKKLAPPWRGALGGWLLGSAQFAARVYAVLASDRNDGRWISPAVLNDKSLTVTPDEIAAAVSKIYGIDPKILKHRGPCSRTPRSAFMLIARDRAGMTLETVGDYLGIRAKGSVANTISRARRREAEDRKFRNAVSRLKLMLKH